MKTVLITGASRGIGRACAHIFAQNGYSVAIHYNKSEASALSLQQELCSIGCDCDLFSADIADRDQVFDMTAQVIARFGRLDVLVANAGIAQQKLFTDITEHDWRTMLDVNLGGVFYSCQAALPHMINQKSGKIVTVSSIWGLCGASCEVHYSAAKGGVIALTKALAQEVAPSGITVNCVAPGVTATDMCAGFSEQDLAALAESTPLGRLGTAADIAKSIYFLCSSSADFITGQVISPNGGIVI